MHTIAEIRALNKTQEKLINIYPNPAADVIYLNDLKEPLKTHLSSLNFKLKAPGWAPHIPYVCCVFNFLFASLSDFLEVPYNE